MRAYAVDSRARAHGFVSSGLAARELGEQSPRGPLIREPWVPVARKPAHFSTDGPGPCAKDDPESAGSIREMESAAPSPAWTGLGFSGCGSSRGLTTYS